MNSKKYTSTELVILMFILLNTNTSIIIINSFKSFNIIEIIISILIAFILGYPLLLFSLKLQNDNYINNIKSKKILKYIIIPLLITTLFIFMISNLINTSNILKDVLLEDYSNKIIIIFLFLISFLLYKKELKSISIAANLFFIIYFFIIIITFIFNISNIEPINILPITTNITNYNHFFLLIFINTPLFFMLLIPKNEIIDYKKYLKDSKRVYIIFHIYLLIKILFIISILSINYYNVLKYPEIEILKSINIFNFIEKLEEILIINIYIESIISTSIILLYLSKLLNNKYYNYLIVITTLIAILNINYIDKTIALIANTIFIIINLFCYKKRYP